MLHERPGHGIFKRKVFSARTLVCLVKSFSLSLWLASLMMLGSSLAADAPDFAWAVSAGGGKHDKTRGITVDAKGFAYITGEFAGESKFGMQTIKSAGDMDCFVAKLDPNGKILWARTGGGSQVDRGYGVAVDEAGNVYATGHYQSADASFDGQKVSLVGGYDIFLAKYDADGKLLWVKTSGGAGYDYGHGAAVDADGNCFIAGGAAGEVIFDQIKLPNEPGGHIFAAKYSPEGKVLWARVAEGKGSGSAHGVAVDRKGNSYLGGMAGGAQMIGGKTLSVLGTQDLAVVKLNPAGEVVWVANSGHPNKSAMLHEIAVDAAGNVWGSGMFKGDVQIGETKGTSAGDSNALLVHFDSSGKLKWALTGGGAGTDYGLGIAANDSGSCWFSGEFTGEAEIFGRKLTSKGATDIHVGKLDADGKLLWMQQAGGDKGDNSYTIAVDHDGNAWFSGSCSGMASFGTHTTTSAGNQDVYVAKLKAK